MQFYSVGFYMWRSSGHSPSGGFMQKKWVNSGFLKFFKFFFTNHMKATSLEEELQRMMEEEKKMLIWCVDT